MAQHFPLFTPHSPNREQQPSPMCVITDLFDISEADWFTSRLDKSPSRNSSTNLNSPPHPPQHQPENKQPELELLTPEVDASEKSFNVLTTQSENDAFQPSFQPHFNVQLPLDITETIQLANNLPLEEHIPFGNQDLLKYTSLQDEDSHKREENTTTQKTPHNPISLETQIEPIDHVLQTTDQRLKLDDQITPVDDHQSQVLTTLTTGTEEISFDELYQAISVNGHPLPDVHSYISALAGTAPLLDHSTYQESKPRPRKKRKLSKREAARAASAAEMAREEELAMLANTKQITDDELLRLKPKKQRRAARFDKPVPSRFCHVCSRTPKNVRLVVCCKIKEGICRKVICEKCFEEYNWGDFEEALNTDSSQWVCPHCSGQCPERAQCRTYQRINDRLRVNRLKQEGPRIGKRRIRRQMEQRVEPGDEKRPRFLLPAVAPSEFEGFDVVSTELGIVQEGLE